MAIFERVNQIIKTTNTTDFRVHSYDGVNLVLTGSFDFAYYHEVEVEFREVAYISLPSCFENPNFRIGTPEEIEAVRKVIALEKEDIVYCVEAETSCSTEKLPFFIVAEDVTVREGKVFYYERENLKEGERIMAGVKTNT